LAESGLFRGLRAKKLKKFRLLNSPLRLRPERALAQSDLEPLRFFDILAIIT
jgi:hypothetical protein